MYDTKKIREKREALGISGEDLAKKFGMGSESLYKMEQNGHKPRDSKVRKKIKDWLGEDVFIKRITPRKPNLVKTNGHAEDYEKKYIALLERTNANYEAVIKTLTK